MQRRYLPIFILTGILFATALIGYLVPAHSDGPPVRTLLENKGGKVLFTHKAHIELEENNCAYCHHTSGNDQQPPRCADCHAKKFDEAFVERHQEEIDDKYCKTCHHPGAIIDKFSHQDHAEDYVEDDCEACHHDPSVEPAPQACSNCHEQEGSEKVPTNLREANHARCADCHDDMYKDGLKGCTNCHTRQMAKDENPNPQACSDCHTQPLDQLVPNTTAAFHGQCMGCHEEQGSGPFGDDACYQCHMK
ncbi:cytochrome c3 family protein [Pseudodesulfovibrio sp. zrk46]|uniref:cytochrome c3 family protein n=1 Tax=Pseudodesulfovibrio sp. zrk46 TaxID=2725288 RepID=UPI00144978E2|nr:cytochrome c3 family protein [Pseudodesulfovibrio sp. zrk46]QJB57972.1 cytochrome c3 family protein [Pseudodesulfovibrio sp. zrk46]